MGGAQGAAGLPGLCPHWEKYPFSSAIINSIQAQEALDAGWWATDQRQCQRLWELQSFQLKNTPIQVYYSTKYFELIPGYNGTPSIPTSLWPKLMRTMWPGVDPEVQGGPGPAVIDCFAGKPPSNSEQNPPFHPKQRWEGGFLWGLSELCVTWSCCSGGENYSAQVLEYQYKSHGGGHIEGLSAIQRRGTAGS